jgi:hypothetical protein
LATVGALSVVAGGVAKATWKLILALDGPEVAWLDAMLFPLLLIGFTCLAIAMWQVELGELGETA